jgi:hypothetical protein
MKDLAAGREFGREWLWPGGMSCWHPRPFMGASQEEMPFSGRCRVLHTTYTIMGVCAVLFCSAAYASFSFVAALGMIIGGWVWWGAVNDCVAIILQADYNDLTEEAMP